jgi:hypothetical protein
MIDLTDVLHRVERNTPPDLWPTIQGHGPLAPVPDGPAPRRLPTILAAAAIMLLALSFAWHAFGGHPTTASDAPLVGPSPAEAVPSVTETIVLHDTTGSHEFAPPPEGATPALSPDQALDVFIADHPEIEIHRSDVHSLELGSYSAVDPDGTAAFQNRLAYGFFLHICGSSAPTTCEFWVFIDADDGHMLDTAWNE